MKRIVSILLCAVLLLSLAACGASAPADADDNAPASALELLETVWNSYSDDEKFPAAGGDYPKKTCATARPATSAWTMPIFWIPRWAFPRRKPERSTVRPLLCT